MSPSTSAFAGKLQSATRRRTAIVGLATLGALVAGTVYTSVAASAQQASAATTRTAATSTTAAAGSVAVGSADYPVPAGAIFVATTGSDTSGTGSIGAPYATVAHALGVATSGSTVVLRAGSYDQYALVRPGLNVTIQSYPNEAVWFDGSVPVTSWVKSGSDWVHSGWTTQFDHSASFTTGSDVGGFVNAAHPMAAWPDQVFVDGVQLQQVSASPAAGEFAVDYANQQLIVGSDPTGHAVRASNLKQALVIGGQATLRGFGVRNYATPLPQIGAVFFGGTTGNSTVENVVVDNNATQGIATNSPNDVINHVSATNNGMTGIESEHTTNGVIENSLVSGNNTQGFNAAPSAAGIKVLRVDGFTLSNNLVQNNHNIGGIWTDENVTDFVITGNTVLNNGTATGITNELSATGIVAGNTVTGSKYGYTNLDSSNIRVFNNNLGANTVWDIGLLQDNRYQPGKGTAGASVQPSTANPWLVQNDVAANNNFGRDTASFQYYVLDNQTNRPASAMNLQIAGNLFAPKTTSSSPYAIGWGMADNHTVHMYATPSAFDTGEGKTWTNAVAPAGTGFADGSAYNTSALPLPADIAAALGQPTGTQHMGAF